MNTLTTRLWHTEESAAALRELGSSPEQGLSPSEAEERRKTYGPNLLTAAVHASAFMMFLGQFANVLIIVLLIGTVLSAFLGDVIESITIGIIVLLAVTLGFVQEFRAEKAMEALKAMAAPLAKVIRGGKEIDVPAAELTLGDIVLLSAGNRVPADGRLLEAHALRNQEGALTGESVPSEKSTDAIPGDTIPPGDRHNMVFAGTTVATGRGTMLVTGIGMNTEFGKIAGMLQDVKTEKTPLEHNLDKVGKNLAKVALGVVLVISVLGLLHGKGIIEMALFAVALAVAVVPEALPAVVTISLSIGVQRMVKRHALIRKLHAVETLGCTTVICSDKTGTLTRDEMTVRSVWMPGKMVDVSGGGYEPKGEFTMHGKATTLDHGFMELLRGATLSSDAKITRDDGRFGITGDPTEGALVVLSEKAGMTRVELEIAHPRTGEIAFTSETKRMTTLHKTEAGTMSYTKGAPEVLLPLCTRIWGATQEEVMTEEDREHIHAAARSMAEKALRVIAVARKGGTGLEGAQEGMKFLGLIGMIDPPRSEAKEALAKCKGAGIRVLMITGDHPVTAQAIARELGILHDERVVTGVELEAMSDSELDTTIDSIRVFARVSPGHKLRIVTTLQKHGHVVAMTGDGVNDAPALKKADIGIAMGITGTDVSKEAAAMTLTDDNFASIVAAVEEGRGIFGNIKKYLMYLLSSNVGEIFIMTIASLFNWALPLSAVQLLYVNLATDGFPALALAVDPPEPDLMRQPPRKTNAGIFNRNIIALMLTGSVWLAIITLGIFQYATLSGLPQSEAMTLTFALLVVAEFVKAYNFRSDRLSAFTNTFKNTWLNIAILWEVALLLCIIYVPFLQTAFGTFALTPKDWLLVVGLALSVIPVLEASKWIIRRNPLPA